MTSTGHDRLHSGREISHVLGGRRQRAGRLVALHARCASSPTGARPRVAVIASRRVGGAVQRNRAKRLLREAARHLTLREGCDIVLVARPRCALSGLREVVGELERLCRHTGVLEDTAGDLGAGSSS